MTTHSPMGASSCRAGARCVTANGTACARGSRRSGLKLHAEEVGKGIAEREQGESIAYGVLDPSAFKEDGGPSIAERIASGSGGKVWFRHADNTRVPARGAMGGRDQVRSRLVGDGDGRPMIVTFATCTDSIRTIPFLQHDPDRHEDVMTDSEDHACDEWRYACMSRPWVPMKEAPKPENISGYRLYRMDASRGSADVLSFLSGQIGFSLQGKTCSHALSAKRVGRLRAYGKTLTKIRFMISTKPALSEIGFGVCKNDRFSTRCMV